MPKTATQPGDRCHDAYCGAILTEHDLSMGLCPKCGAMLHQDFSLAHAEKIEKSRTLVENTGR